MAIEVPQKENIDADLQKLKKLEIIAKKTWTLRDLALYCLSSQQEHFMAIGMTADKIENNLRFR